MAKIDFDWELGAGTGHVATLHPLALAMKARGHAVRFLQRDASAGADLERAAEIPREGAPVWVGPLQLGFGMTAWPAPKVRMAHRPVCGFSSLTKKPRYFTAGVPWLKRPYLT